MNRGLVTLATALLCLATSVTVAPEALAGPSPGGACKRPGTTFATPKWLFSCKDGARGARWVRSPLPLAYGARITPAAELLPTEACKIIDISANQDTWRTSSGTNRPSWTVSSSAPLNLLVIPVSFPDAQFGDTDLAYVKGGYEYAQEFLSYASLGRSGLNITYAPRDKWVNMPMSARDWNLDPGPYGEGNSTMRVDTWGLNRAVMDAADPSLNLQNYPVVAIVAPVSGVMALTNRTEAMPAFMHTTSNGALVRGATFGAANVSKESVVHELGHAWLGFEDLYGPLARNDPTAYAQYPQGWFPRWDLMSDNTDMGAWTRFVSGWLTPSEIRCAPANRTTTHALQMLVEPGKQPRALFVPISESHALVIEVRSITRYTASYATGPTVVVYDVDTQNDHAHGPFRLRGEITKSSPSKSVTTATHVVSVDRLDSRGAVVTVTPR